MDYGYVVLLNMVIPPAVATMAPVPLSSKFCLCFTTMFVVCACTGWFVLGLFWLTLAIVVGYAMWKTGIY